MKNKREKKEEIRENFKNSSEKFFSRFFALLRIPQLSNKIVDLANNNKKKMFAVTITFLTLLAVFSIGRAIYTTKNLKIEKSVDSLSIPLSPPSNTINSTPSKSLVKDVLKLYELQSTFNELKSKDVLTSEDSLLLIELYEQLQINDYEE